MSCQDLHSRDRNFRPIARTAAFPEAVTDAEADGLSGLMPSVYEELRRLAADYLRGERPRHTLPPTALVHEAYLRLLRQGQTTCQNRAHVLGFGARIIRQILISHAIASPRLTRGGPDSIRITLDEGLDFYDRREMSVSAVDEALQSLEEIDPRQGQIVEMLFFGGLTIEEIAKVLDVSSATVKRDWTFAKVWLRRELPR